MAYASELRAALQAVRTASRICQNVQTTLVADADATGKADRSPVTVADFAAQASIIHDLNRAFPEDPVMGEEDASLLRDPAHAELAAKVVAAVQTEQDLQQDAICRAIDAGNHPGGAQGRFWTLDPIDGTKGFLRGEQYAVALALLVDGDVVLGVLGCPNLPYPSVNDNELGALLYAVKGEGAFQQALEDGFATSISVDPDPDVRHARLAESVESGHTSHGMSHRISEALGIRGMSVRLDSQAKYAVCARGDATVYLRLPKDEGYEEKIWDHAAGCIIGLESGGRVTDIHGADLDFSRGTTLKKNRGVVMSNGPVHEELLAAVGAARKG